ncbi:probable porin protein (plasmid) [Aromatoleum aromaticum EbN1]|uniref:Porin n=3 Tax=Rhodocyclaceae TaxID=75787 RepID=A0ABX1N6V9_9RHOO|nr:probable porin protein [Aromatoleum aromaticum EbN1]
MRKKRLYVIVVTGGLMVPLVAQADSSNVVIYGKLYPQIGQAKTTGATRPGAPVSTLTGAPGGNNIASHTEINASNSRLGFRGSEDLGNGYKAHFQIEQRVSIDSNTGLSSARNSFVGLSGDFGLVKLGIHDSVYKSLGDGMNFLGISSGNFVSNSNILSKPAFGISKPGSFHLRPPNTILYESPKFAGFQVHAQYATDEGKTDERDPHLQSYGVIFGRGGLYVAVAHEIHTDYFGGSRNAPAALSNFTAAPDANSKDTGTRATLRYKFGNSRIEGNYAMLKYKETDGLPNRFKEYKQNAWSLGFDHRFGNWLAAISYARASADSCSLVGGAACSTSGLDGDMWSLGGSYSLSKRTSLFAMATRLTNGRSARFNNMENGSADTGADITQAALGISHSF